eukprot:CAMPEP_0170638516 /NCGR_PEP_ID=MMETSP0224-20130122/39091_1 /TAXON_ID=285029 /ORGANISM="Togula jolla, Strain CCCM 725" /LENGTH=39 /DNA_ID= /DNA_START= /DNA_END= /DNA_ORIENTATION=
MHMVKCHKRGEPARPEHDSCASEALAEAQTKVRVKHEEE